MDAHLLDSDKYKEKMRSTDRILVLKPPEGKVARGVDGLPDKRLFNGENRLHAVQLPNGMWVLKFDHGSLPQPLKQTFTRFNILVDFVRAYYAKRNIEIKEVID